MKSSHSYLRYVDLEFKPSSADYVLTRYKVRRNPYTRLDGLAFLGAIAAESSTGTWIEVADDNLVKVNVSGTVYRYDEDKGECFIAYPAGLFEPGNASQLLTVIAGNAFGLADIVQLKLMDFSVPAELVGAFPGPAIGLEGIYATLGIPRTRPIVGAIAKPKCGLDADQHAALAYAAWVGKADEGGSEGVDMVKDDEALTSQHAFSSDFYVRMEKTLSACKRAEDVTGSRKIYVPNVTHSLVAESLRRCEFVRRHSGAAAMIDFVIGGGVLLHSVRHENFGLILHGHRTLFAAMHRPDSFGVDYAVWAKLFRMIGGDQIHVGTPALGVMQSDASVVRTYCDMMRDRQFAHADYLAQDFGKCLAVAPISGAGLDLHSTAPLTAALGTDVIMFAGGGCHGHPHGTAAGAACLRESANAVQAQTELNQYTQQRRQPYLDAGYSYFKKFDRQSSNENAREDM